MPSNCKLILVEGLCGMGKSTLAERLHRNIENQGVPSSFYDEGAYGHPASLNCMLSFETTNIRNY